MKPNGKTIKQVADEIGVSKQAVRDKIAKLELGDKLQSSGNQFVITKSQETIIKQAFEQTKAQSENRKVAEKKTQITDKLFDMIIHQNEQLSKELEIKNKQISDLTEALRAEQTLHAESKGMLQTSEQQLITDGTDKPTFKDRLKYLFKGER
ncbi:MAG: hypothetical protein PHI40_07750 [Caldisericia bacterium]|nr:hypothetical protein [Caldisericia bacterium]